MMVSDIFVRLLNPCWQEGDENTDGYYGMRISSGGKYETFPEEGFYRVDKLRVDKLKESL